ncbi:MAG TPA: D-alanyl-D-alanine carboxypeptidase/D-alanyl-D-alanine-endopeptidase, partial [Ignavibacteria bacterium]|nr:D-alanyl-D-alanine carboxypeptidase/D-alanyl-D-alanine-endopeptidase [Ignavibacteria bacterium]
KNLKVKRITGNIFADVSLMDSLFWGKGWMWDDDPSTSAPYLSSLNINKNSVQVITAPQKINKQSKVTFYPESKYYSTEANVISIKGDSTKIKVSRDWINRKNKILVNGFQFYKDDVDTSEVNIFRPELFFITLLKEQLNKVDIKFTGKLDTLTIPDNAIKFLTIKRGLDSVIIKTNKESNNLGAEMILYALAEKFYGFPATAENGVKVIDSLITLIGHDPGNYRIVDGSGVSHYNLITADLIIDLLKHMYNRKDNLFSLYYNSLPVAGVDGTLKDRMITSQAYNNVHAKTGTLSGVSNISGYVTAANGDKLAFSILMQNYVGKSKPARDLQDSLCTILSLYK